MNWLEIAAIVALLIGIAGGGFLIAQRPSFWWGIGSVAVKAGIKATLPYLLRRMTPAQEAAFHDCVRRGGEWDYHRKRCKK